MTKVTIAIAAEMTGKSRETINLATRNGELSFERNERKHKVIDVSELSRRFKLVKTLDQINQEASVAKADRSASKSVADSASDLATLQERLSHGEEIRAMLEGERDRERRHLVREIESLKESLEKTQASLERSQEQHSKALLLITDQSQETTERVGDWEKAIQALEEKITSQANDFESRAVELQEVSKQETIENIKSSPWPVALWRLLRE